MTITFLDSSGDGKFSVDQFLVAGETVSHPIAKTAFGAVDTVTLVTPSVGLPVTQLGAIPAGGNNIGDVDVVSLPAKATTASAIVSTTVGPTPIQVFALNVNRKWFSVVCTGITNLYVALHVSTNPSITAYTFPLKACTVANDATGGVLTVTEWTGRVSIISAASGGTFCAQEFS